MVGTKREEHTDESVAGDEELLKQLLPSAGGREAYDVSTDLAEAAHFIRNARIAANLSQAQLAVRVGVSPERICQLEKVSAVDEQTRRDGPTYTILKRVKRACSGEPQGLLDGPLEALLSDSTARETFYESMDLAEAAHLIRDFRLNARLSQGELAGRIGVSQERVCQLEKVTGKNEAIRRQGPTYTLLKRIARACEVQWAIS